MQRIFVLTCYDKNNIKVHTLKPSWHSSVGRAFVCSTIDPSFEPHQFLLVSMWKRTAWQPCWLPRGRQVSEVNLRKPITRTLPPSVNKNARSYVLQKIKRRSLYSSLHIHDFKMSGASVSVKYNVSVQTCYTLLRWNDSFNCGCEKTLIRKQHTCIPYVHYYLKVLSSHTSWDSGILDPGLEPHNYLYKYLVMDLKWSSHHACGQQVSASFAPKANQWNL